MSKLRRCRIQEGERRAAELNSLRKNSATPRQEGPLSPGPVPPRVRQWKEPPGLLRFVSQSERPTGNSTVSGRHAEHHSDTCASERTDNGVHQETCQSGSTGRNLTPVSNGSLVSSSSSTATSDSRECTVFPTEDTVTNTPTTEPLPSDFSNHQNALEDGLDCSVPERTPAKPCVCNTVNHEGTRDSQEAAQMSGPTQSEATPEQGVTSGGLLSAGRKRKLSLEAHELQDDSRARKSSRRKESVHKVSKRTRTSARSRPHWENHGNGHKGSASPGHHKSTSKEVSKVDDKYS